MVDLRDEISDLSKGFIVTIIAPALKYNQINTDTLKLLLTDRKHSGVYLTFNRPYENIKTMLQNDGVKTDNLFFIDTVSNLARGKSEKTENCLYVGSPESLTEISIAINQAIQALPGDEKFLFLDSVSALLIYNQAGTVARFAHVLTVKMRELNIMGVLISLELETDELLFSRLSQFSDKMIVIDGDE